MPATSQEVLDELGAVAPTPSSPAPDQAPVPAEPAPGEDSSGGSALTSQQILEMFGTADEPAAAPAPTEKKTPEPSQKEGSYDSQQIIELLGTDAPQDAPAEEEDDGHGILSQIKGGFHEFMSRELTSQALKDADRVVAREAGEEFSGDVSANQFGGISQTVKTARAKTDEDFKAKYLQESRDILQDRIEKSIEHRKKGEEIPFSKETQEFLDENSSKTIWEAFSEAPLTIIAELGARSAPSMIPSIVLGTGGGMMGAASPIPGAATAGFAAGMGAGSARVEYAASLVDFLKKSKVDVENADAIIEAIQDESLMNQANEYAMRRSAVIGGVDAIAGLVGAKQLAPGLSNKLAKEFLNVTGQTVIQAGLGAAGEAGAQVANLEELQPRQIAAEAAGELVTAPVDVASAAVAGTRKDAEYVDPVTAETDSLADELDAVDVAYSEAAEAARAEGGDALAQTLAGTTNSIDANVQISEERDQLAATQALQEQALAEEQRIADENVKLEEQRQAEVAEQEAAKVKQQEEAVAKAKADETFNKLAERRAELGLGPAPAPAPAVEEKAEAAPEPAAPVTPAPANSAMLEAFKSAKPEKIKQKRAKKLAEKVEEAPIPEPAPEPVAEQPATEKVEEAPAPEPAPAPETKAEEVEVKAQEASTSKLNDLPEPSEAQIKAGNYKKGHVSVQGHDITIENPTGSTRSGVSEDGKAWNQELKDHYGYIRRTKGADGDHVDVFLGDQPEAESVFVVDQIDQKTASFDEHKVMMGYPNQLSAVKAYKRNYAKGWSVGPVTEMTQSEFKTWIRDGDNTVPVRGDKVAATGGAVVTEQDIAAISATQKRKRRDSKVRYRTDATPKNNTRLGRAQSRFPVANQQQADALLGERRTRPEYKAKNKAPKITREQAATATKDLQTELQGANINIAASVNELPANIAKRLRDDGATGAKGLYDPNTDQVYILSDNHADTGDVVRTVLHEAVAHKGTRVLLRDDFDATMEDVYQNVKNARGMDKIAKSAGVDINTAEGRQIAAEEFIASIAEDGTHASVLNRVIAKVRKALRRIGAVSAWTDNDIRELLQASRRELKRTPTSKMIVTTETENSRTGEVTAVDETADKVVRQLDKRMDVVNQLKDCIKK